MPVSTAGTIQLYRRLLGYTAPYWRMFAGALAGLVIVASTEPLLPLLAQPLLDRSFVDRDPTFMRWVPLMIIAIFLVRGLASFGSDYCMQWTAQKVIADLRADMFDTLIRPAR